MTAARVLKVLGVVDVASGAAAVVLASWLAGELDVSATALRLVGALLVVLGIETYTMATRPLMAKVSIVTEAISALVAVELLLAGDPTTFGTVLLVGTAVMCAAFAVELAMLVRTRTLTPA